MLIILVLYYVTFIPYPSLLTIYLLILYVRHYFFLKFSLFCFIIKVSSHFNRMPPTNKRHIVFSATIASLKIPEVNSSTLFFPRFQSFFSCCFRFWSRAQGILRKKEVYWFKYEIQKDLISNKSQCHDPAHECRKKARQSETSWPWMEYIFTWMVFLTIALILVKVHMFPHID